MPDTLACPIWQLHSLVLLRQTYSYPHHTPLPSPGASPAAKGVLVATAGRVRATAAAGHGVPHAAEPRATPLTHQAHALAQQLWPGTNQKGGQYIRGEKDWG